MTKGEQGIYALYRKNKLYYVGLATNLRNRIKHHLKDRHKDHWTHFSLYIIRKVDHIKELESLLLRIAFPEGNSQKGKLKTSTNLMPMLMERVEETQARELVELFKGVRLLSTKSKKVRRVKEKGILFKEPVFARKKIRATYKGKVYKAIIYRDGRVEYRGRLFDSPSAAGKSVRNGKETNGWTFWKIKNKNGRLVRLSTIRKG